jgi:hypothetical protein
MSKDKLTRALDTLHWALSEYCEDHHRDGLHAEKAWKLLLKETKSIVSRLIHPAADDTDVDAARDFLAAFDSPAE